MPGVLIIEAMAQVGGIFFLETMEGPGPNIAYLSGIDKARFRRAVVPGDQLRFEIEALHMRKTSCKMKGKAYVGDELVAEAEIFSIADSKEK